MWPPQAPPLGARASRTAAAQYGEAAVIESNYFGAQWPLRCLSLALWCTALLRTMNVKTTGSWKRPDMYSGASVSGSGGAKAEVTPTPVTIASAAHNSPSVRRSRAQIQPVEAPTRVNTIASPAKGAIMVMGRSEYVKRFSTVGKTANRVNPASQHRRCVSGLPASVSALCFSKSKPVELKRHAKTRRQKPRNLFAVVSSITPRGSTDLMCDAHALGGASCRHDNEFDSSTFFRPYFGPHRFCIKVLEGVWASIHPFLVPRCKEAASSLDSCSWPPSRARQSRRVTWCPDRSLYLWMLAAPEKQLPALGASFLPPKHRRPTVAR